MTSYDVTSLSTNISLGETIRFTIDLLFGGEPELKINGRKL